MTTTIIVHNGHREVTVRTYDRKWDSMTEKMSDEWAKVDTTVVKPGNLYQGYCTDTRRIEIVEE